MDERVNEAVKNNPDKFPHDYMFEISESEFVDLRSKFSTTKFAKTRSLELNFAVLKFKHTIKKKNK